MTQAPPSLPESTPRRMRAVQPGRSREESYKRWTAVMMSTLALLVGLTTFLQTDLSNRAARLNRIAQANALASTSAAARGQQNYTFGTYVAVREYDELRSQAQRLRGSGAVTASEAYLHAADVLTPLTPMLQPEYAESRPSDGWLLPDYARFEADQWVVTATLTSQRRDAALIEASGLDEKAGNFVAALAIYAVAIFLLGLSITIAGPVRWMLFVVSITLSLAALIGSGVTIASPVQRIPDAAIEQYARGAGLMWREQFTEAVKAYDKAIALAPDYAAAYAERGAAHLRLAPGGLDAALRDYHFAIARGLDRYEDNWSLGWAYYLSGNYPRAIEYSQRAVAMNNSACGPMFNIAVARLAQGNATAGEKAYEDAIAYCDAIARAPEEKGLSGRVGVWVIVQAAVNDIEDLLCQTHQRYCFAGREQPQVRSAGNRDTVLALGLKYRQRVKEALVTMEYYPGRNLPPSGASVEPLRFAGKAYDEASEYRSYIERARFPNDERSIYAIFTYTGLPVGTPTVWKVFRDGHDEFGLRYDEAWRLNPDGNAEKAMTQRYGLQPGTYEVEFYANSKLVAAGEFTLEADSKFEKELPPNERPEAPVAVGGLSFAEDFEDNDHGWWTGQIDRSRLGELGGGQFRLLTNRPEDTFRVLCMACYGPDNMYYEVNTEYRDGPTDYGYGMIARANYATDQGYLFLINALGSYSVWRLEGKNSPTKLADWATHNAIRKEGENRLGVLAKGATLEFYANGQLLRRVTDSVNARGWFGLTVERTALEVAFSQVRIWQAR